MEALAALSRGRCIAALPDLGPLEAFARRELYVGRPAGTALAATRQGATRRLALERVAGVGVDGGAWPLGAERATDRLAEAG